MAENNRYDIIIKFETNEGIASEVGGAGGVSSGGDNSSSSGGATTGTGNSSGTAKILKRLYGYKTIKSTVNQIATYEHSQVELRTGSRERQQRATFAYEMVSSAYSVVEGAVAGGMLGGPAGAATGAVLALINQLTSKLTSIITTNATLNTERQLEDISRNLAAQRVTVSGSRYMNATQF